MIASKIDPPAWRFGDNPKKPIIMRKWDGIIRNTRRMEENLLALMANSQTTPDQLALASKMYVSVTKQLHDHANVIDAYLYYGVKPAPAAPHCGLCGSTEQPIEEDGAYPYCPVCQGV